MTTTLDANQDVRRRVLGPDHPQTVDSLVQLDFILGQAGQPDEQLALFEQGHDAIRRLDGQARPRERADKTYPRRCSSHAGPVSRSHAERR
jgi:hypothetical protein